MQSLYDDIFDALDGYTFTIPNVDVREPFDETDKTYPLIVLHEIVNVPHSHTTVTGEATTALSYQFDIQTHDCQDASGNVLSKAEAGRRMVAEVNDLMDTTFKLTRRFCRPEAIASDVLQNTLRMDCVADSGDYTYRPE